MLSEDAGPSLGWQELTRDGTDTIVTLTVSSRGIKIGTLRIRTKNNEFYRPIRERDIVCSIRQKEDPA